MIIHNEVIDNILSRRSIRSYTDQQISQDELDTILEAGKYAPSGMNQQTARTVVVQSKERMQELVDLTMRLNKMEINPFYNAPTVILVFGNTAGLTYTYDGALAIENMFLAANSLNIGTCWIYAVTPTFATDEGKAWLKKIGVPDSYAIIGSIAVGYTADPIPDPKPREGQFSTII